MARRYEIENALRSAIKKAPNGKTIVTTQDFVAELEKVSWHWSHAEANAWIRSRTTCFRDISTEEGEAKTWFMFNPNGGL